MHLFSQPNGIPTGIGCPNPVHEGAFAVILCHCESLPLRSYCQSWHHEPVPSMPCKRCHSPSISDVVKRFLVESMFLNKHYKLQTHAAPYPCVPSTATCWRDWKEPQGAGWVLRLFMQWFQEWQQCLWEKPEACCCAGQWHVECNFRRLFGLNSSNNGHTMIQWSSITTGPLLLELNQQ